MRPRKPGFSRDLKRFFTHPGILVGLGISATLLAAYACVYVAVRAWLRVLTGRWRVVLGPSAAERKRAQPLRAR